MYGNVPFVLRVIGLAIVFSILLIAANTMMTSIRERTGEFGVLKTLGFSDGAVFRMVVLEAAERVLSRVTAPAVSSFYEKVHR